jgi:hypothetical protein
VRRAHARRPPSLKPCGSDRAGHRAMYSGRVRLHTGLAETHRRYTAKRMRGLCMSRIGVESGPKSGFRRIRDNDNGIGGATPVPR